MMKLHRRDVLRLCTGAAVLPAASRVLLALDYPTRPVRIVLGGLPGSPIDTAARITGQWLQDRLGQPFVVEDRAGAGGNVATEIVARAAPDGYTLLMTQASSAINTTLYRNLTFDFLRDIAPIASVARIPLLLVVHPSLPVNTVAELIAYARANPGTLNLGSPAIGTAPEVACELFKMMADVKMTSVPYRSSPPLLTDLLAGRVEVAIDAVLSTMEHVKAGKLKALAAASAERLKQFPDLPTVAETVPGFEAGGWTGVCAPKNTPAAIVATLNREVNAALADPATAARFAEVGTLPFASSPEGFAAFIAAETQKWAKVVKFAGLKVE